MTQNLIYNLIDSVRGERVAPADAVLLAGVLVTWQVLSHLEQIPATLRMNDDLQKSPREAEKMLIAVSEEIAAPAFLEASAALGRISPHVASELLKRVRVQFQQGLWDAYDPSDLVTVSGPARGDEGYLPPEICDLLFDLATTASDLDRSVYLPWESSGQMLGRFMRHGFAVSAEIRSQQQAYFADVVGAYFKQEASAAIQLSDPISSPAFIIKGALAKFDIVVATPPFGGKSSIENQLRDPFNRFPEKSNSLTVLAIRHVLAQAKGRAVVLVSNSILFAAGSEKRLRKDLLESGVLESVISLPAGLLYNAAIPCSVLILNCAGGCDAVRLINCDSEKYKRQESRTRFTLTNTQRIGYLLKFGQEPSEDFWVGSREEIYNNDLNLLPSRYVRDESMEQLSVVSRTYEKKRLDEMVEILRPILGRDEGNDVPAIEVGAADVSDSGFLAAPSKRVMVDDTGGRGTDYFLRPNDVLIVIKGSVGKVTIAPGTTPPPGPGGWIAGQSMAVLRPRDPAYGPLLTVFLRSGVGQELIRRLVAGAAIPFLQIRELRQLEVPAMTTPLCVKAAEILIRQFNLGLEIQKLQKELASVKFDEWELPTAKS